MTLVKSLPIYGPYFSHLSVDLGKDPNQIAEGQQRSSDAGLGQRKARFKEPESEICCLQHFVILMSLKNSRSLNCFG